MKCSFCRQSIVQEDGNMKWNTVWHKVYGWLCYYCATGLKENMK